MRTRGGSVVALCLAVAAMLMPPIVARANGVTYFVASVGYFI